MIKYTTNIEKVRRYTALSIAFLVFMTILFISIFSFLAHSLNNVSEDILKYSNQGVEDYLELQVFIQSNFVETLSDSWNVYAENYGHEGIEKAINNFIDNELAPFHTLDAFSMVILSGDGKDIVHAGYVKEEYEDIIPIFTKGNVPADNNPYVMDSKGSVHRFKDKDLFSKHVFGQDNRVFITGTELGEIQGETLYMYVGFYEPVMIDLFISSLNLSLVDRLNGISDSMMLVSAIFMVSIIFYGVILLGIIRWSTVKTLMWFFKTHPVGELAISKGYMTRDQLEECLKEQDEGFNDDRL